MELQQRELVIRLKQGDEPSFNALYKAYSRPLYLRILKMVRDRAVADELLQELLIRVWDKRHQVDPDKPFKAYIYTIAQNLVYNYFRKVASDKNLIQTLIYHSAGQYLEADTWLENREAADLIKEAINQLPPQRKLVFNLCKIEGKSYEETSRLMGISIATVNSHMSLAFKTIEAYVLKHRDLAFVILWWTVVGFITQTSSHTASV